jgi:hypothetical protein
MNRGLVTGGIVLVVLGVVLFFYVMFATSGRVDDLGAIAAPQGPMTVNDVSRLWGVVAGLCFAAGLALVGIGMNRWRERT